MKQSITFFLLSVLLTANAAQPFTITNSGAFTIVENEAGRPLSIVPNYKTGAVTINFKAARAQRGIIIVLDKNGQTVLRQDASIRAGANTIPINNFINLNEGSYNVFVKAGKNTHKTTYLLWK